MINILSMMTLLGVFVLSSCSKKDNYTCSCETAITPFGTQSTIRTSTYEYIDRKETEVEDLCNNKEVVLEYEIVAGTYRTEITTCMLK